MYSASDLGASFVGNFRINGMMMRYSDFIPRFYNLCKSLGFQPGKTMPSRAFCSDENQGFPIILITKHFGTFPFNHGRVGGVVSIDRHAPHAHHGKDVVIIQASHVGYDPDSASFGSYRRLQTERNEATPTCGKLCSVNDWYIGEYRFAKENIHLIQDNGKYLISIDNLLMSKDREEGLFLRLERMLKQINGEYRLVKSFSTSRIFEVSDEFIQILAGYEWRGGRGEAIGSKLSPDLFYYHRKFGEDVEEDSYLERNIQPVMPLIVTSPTPALTAAQITTQVEFDRTYRSILKEGSYRGKKTLFISGLHIDVSPQPGQIFPLTKFIPWAAYYQDSDGSSFIWEQAELMEKIMEQSKDNPDQIDLEAAIQAMRETEEVRVKL